MPTKRAINISNCMYFSAVFAKIMGGVDKLEEKPPKSWVEWASLRKKRRNHGWSGPVRGKTAKIMGGVGKFLEKPPKSWVEWANLRKSRRLTFVFNGMTVHTCSINLLLWCQ